MEIVEKLQVMLPHWIEHNLGHSREFADWAEKLGGDHAELAHALFSAVNALEEAQQALEKALTLAGGPRETPGHHGHHHHH